MAMKFVNEEIQKYSTLLNSTRMIYSMKKSGNKFTLRFEKRLEGGWTDSLPIQFVRLFLEGTGTVTVDSITVYKFGIPFSKKKSLYSNISPLPITVNVAKNEIVDVPVEVQDEIFEINITAAANSGRIYAVLDGGDHNIEKEPLEKFRKAENIVIP